MDDFDIYEKPLNLISEAQAGDKSAIEKIAASLYEELKSARLSGVEAEIYRQYLLSVLCAISNGVDFKKAFCPNAKQGGKQSLEISIRNMEIALCMHDELEAGAKSKEDAAWKVIDKLNLDFKDDSSVRKIYNNHVSIIEKMEANLGKK